MSILLEYVRDGDTVVCHAMDRLARNLDDLRKIVIGLIERGVHVRFEKENLTFTGADSPMSHLLLFWENPHATPTEETASKEKTIRKALRAKTMSITINGFSVEVPADPRVSLLDLLRDHIDLPGTKKGCNQGACGACTVLADGERILSCLALAVQYEGCSITTVEGLSADGMLHPLQKAFIEHDGFQCGYCTPGQICSAVGMLSEVKRGLPSHATKNLSEDVVKLTGDELRERMSGNLCRCGAYNGIVAAIAEFAESAQ